MEVDKQLKFKAHERMQVEFISNYVDDDDTWLFV